MTGASARYDEKADFYGERAGRSVADGATAALLTLAGQVSGLRLLELTCGQGRVARELAGRGARVAGVDISAAMLEAAKAAETRQPLGIKYVQADVTDPGVLAGQVFDAVACNHGLADVGDLDGLLCRRAHLCQVSASRAGAAVLLKAAVQGRGGGQVAGRGRPVRPPWPGAAACGIRA